MIRNKIAVSMFGGVVMLGLLGGVATTFAQSNAAQVTAPSTIQVHRGGLGGQVDSDQSLADALGIDVETLQTAQETARLAMIDQAVTDGLLTEAQAEQLKLYSGGFGRGHFGAYDEDEYLADALGITVEELEAAELEAYEVNLAAAVEAGYLTQEAADLMLAERVARSYLDTDAIDAQIQSAQEAAIAAALEAGAITQAQADALLAQLEANPYQFNGGFGGRHGGRGGHSGMRGFGLETLPDTTTPDTTPDTTDTALDA